MANKLKRKALEEKESEKNQLLADLLRKQKVKHVKAPKKKTPEELFRVLGCGMWRKYELRPLESHTVKSYNLDRQYRELIKHLYVKYPTPAFMYKCFFPTKPFEQQQQHPFDWFFCIAQGGSFRKLVKDLMTSKEAATFLTAPDDFELHESFWWAKMKHAGAADGVIQKLIFDKGFFNNRAINAQNAEGLAHVFQFYAKYYSEMDELTFDEVTDFIRHKIGNDATFTLRGRTLNSVIALANEWHALQTKAKYGSKVDWNGRGWKPWYYEEQGVIWDVSELLNNHELVNEGRKQRHCVYSYVSSCVTGACNIFSMRRYNARTLIEYEKNRITIEIRRNRMVQVRGSMNRLPTNDEDKVLKRFATAKGLIYERGTNWW